MCPVDLEVIHQKPDFFSLFVYFFFGIVCFYRKHYAYIHNKITFNVSLSSKKI